MNIPGEAGSAASQDVNTFKREAAEMALGFVQPGMVLGLGGGSTALFMVHHLADLLNEGKLHDIVGIPCSNETADLARSLGIPLVDLESHPTIDLTIDGADEVDPHLNLIKGGGGYLLREKIVAQASVREVIIVDESKLSPVLGTHRTLPVEVVPFGIAGQQRFLESLGSNPVLRLTKDGSLFHTENGNVILDCEFGPISDPAALADRLDKRAGVAAHGLFLNLAADLVVCGVNGCKHIRRSEIS